MKRILTIQDISCVGKCSLTVALPVISAFGVETVALPTAVLSAHTAFKGFTFRDLTDDMPSIADHWKSQKITFDAIYTGYLGSFRQLGIVSEIINEFGTKDNFVLVDPVMADNGRLYPGFDEKFAAAMAKLCGKADVIVPNLTEAAFMLGRPFVPFGYDENYIKETLKRLTDLGAENAVLTGVNFDGKHLGVYGYDGLKGEFYDYFRESLPASFHGTGDVFASALCGALTVGKSLKDALGVAVDFTAESIAATMNNPNRNWYGVDFESVIPYLIERIKK